MIYLIEYERKQGRIRTLKAFSARERPDAEGERLAIELAMNQAGISREVVLLEAADEQTLRRTHKRYFKSPRELVQSMLAPVLEPDPGLPEPGLP